MDHLKKKESRNDKNNLIIRLIFITSFCIFTLFLLIKIKQESTKSVWNGNDRITLVWQGTSPAIISYEPYDKELIVLVFPGNLTELASGNYGKYKLGAIYKLDKLENKNGSLFRETFANLLEVPIDAYLAHKNFDSKTDNLTEEEFISVKKNLLSLNGLYQIFWISDFETNLSFFDKINLWLKLQNLRNDKIKLYRLKNQEILIKRSSLEKLSTISLDHNGLASFIKGFFEFSLIKKENFTVEIRNASQITGLGNKLGNLINNIGSQVVAVENDSEIDNTICLTNQKAKNSYTLSKIKILTKCQLQEKENKAADIVLILGKNYPH